MGGGGGGRPEKLVGIKQESFPKKGSFFAAKFDWVHGWGGGGEVGKMKKSHGQPNVSPNQQKRASILFPF